VKLSGLFRINPIEPSVLWSAIIIIDLLNDRSPIIEGSAINK